MNPLQHNRRAWNRKALQGCVWSIPVDGEPIARARTGTWQVILTPRLPVRHALPYSDLHSLPPAELQRKVAGGEPLEWSHSLDDQLGGQIAAGFALTGFYEDRWYDDSWPFSNHCPASTATCALKA